jgi:hypothetical protein
MMIVAAGIQPSRDRNTIRGSIERIIENQHGLMASEREGRGLSRAHSVPSMRNPACVASIKRGISDCLPSQPHPGDHFAKKCHSLLRHSRAGVRHSRAGVRHSRAGGNPFPRLSG